MRPSPQVREEIDKIKRDRVSYSGIMESWGFGPGRACIKNDKNTAKRLNKETMKGVWENE